MLYDLRAWGVRDLPRGQGNLAALAGHLSPDGLGLLAGHLGRLLPLCADPDMALNNLERFFANPAAPPLAAGLAEGRARHLEIFVNVLSTSQTFSDLLSQNPDYLGLLRVPLRKNPTAEELRAALQGEVDAAPDDSGVLRAFRRFRHRQLLRIGTNDVARDRPLEEITRDVSAVADAALEVALAVAHRHVSRRFGRPFAADGSPVTSTVFAFGKLGGEELNYSSDIDLMAVYSDDGETRGKGTTCVPTEEYFARVVGELKRLLAAHTDRGQGYRVDLRLRPEGDRGPLARSLSSTLAY